MECSVTSDAWFFAGLLHGAFAFFTLIADIFWEMSIYDKCQNSWAYDFGFVIGAGVFTYICFAVSWIVVPLIFVAWVIWLIAHNILITISVVVILTGSIYAYIKFIEPWMIREAVRTKRY